MSATLQDGPPFFAEIARGLRRPEAILSPELAGETQVSLAGLSWEGYLAIDEELGHDRPNLRLHYLDGALDIMTSSLRHERLARRIAFFVEAFCEAAGIDIFPHGRTTLRNEMRAAGLEPDESWCLEEDKEEAPHFALEVVISSGGLRKLENYRRFGVREVGFGGTGRSPSGSCARMGRATTVRSAAAIRCPV